MSTRSALERRPTPRPSQEGGPVALPPGATRGSALLALRRAFARAGVERPAQDARLLLVAALGIEPVDLTARPEIALAPGERARVAGYAVRRVAGEPVGRILGRREFWSLPFRLGPDTLEPRPDSETVVETALRLAGDRSRTRLVLDLGTGSGCLLIALLSEWKQVWGVGIDRSPVACRIARDNAVANGVGERCRFAVGDWDCALQGRFDVIVSNPPYVASPDLGALAIEVAGHDPALALDGGPDGLEAYRRLLPACRRLLAPDGLAVFEIGQGQSQDVTQIGRGAGLELRHSAPDLMGTTRALAFATRSGVQPKGTAHRTA